MKFKNIYILIEFFFFFDFFNKTALFMAIELENIEIVKLLLSNSKIDVNASNIIN